MSAFVSTARPRNFANAASGGTELPMLSPRLMHTRQDSS
jgi:hypothetical protein